MNIVFCTDNKYIIPCGVMMTSLCENNKEEEICFYCIADDNVEEENRKKLYNIASKYDKSLTFFRFESPVLDSLPIKDKNRYTKSVYYRLFFAEIFPENIKKVLFLDGDIIVRHSLIDLWNTNLDGFALGAVPDMTDGNMEYYNRLGYSSQDGYFNGGVLLINLDYWRKYGIQDKCVSYCRQFPEKILWNDQDVMNYVLRNVKYNLHLKYNVQHGFFWKNNMNFEWSRYGNEFYEAINDPVILHYNCTKPWVKGCDHPYKSVFFKYKNLTEWKDTIIDYRAKGGKNRIKDFIINILVFLKIKAPKTIQYLEVEEID